MYLKNDFFPMTNLMQTRPVSAEYAAYYTTYTRLVPDGDIISQLELQIEDTLSVLRVVTDEKANQRYAPGKWTLKEAVGHMIDTERMFAYRAMRIARGDKTPMPGFEQDDYVAGANFNDRTLSDLLDEFEAVRRVTILMFSSLTPEAWIRSGIASGDPCTVRSLAYITAGHELHHLNIIKERYLV
jgi:hypothetical protein